MNSEAVIHFPPFHLDCENEQLWQGTQQVPLRPKSFALLRYLVEHAQRLVTKEELLNAVWPETVVSEGLLHTYIRDLRQVLGDEAEAPRFIETVARRGYRFIAPLTATPPVASRQYSVASRQEESRVSGLESSVQQQNFHPTPDTQHPTPHIVGRELEFAQLRSWLDKALRGERQVVFVTGEPGIGKTTLVEAFLEQVTAPEGVWIGIGQCIDGAGEAYLPVLEALGRLCRAPGNERFKELLGRQAPSWLVQMPALLSDAEFEGLQRKVHGTTQERMLRELAEALEVLAAERPVVLWLEDLQWSDYSTLDLLSCLAQRREAARLLVIGTYRPADVILSNHPLKGVKQELHTRRRCMELPLGFLSATAVAQYLAGRFPGSALPARLGPELYRSTEGNPLFMVNVVEYLVGEGWIAERSGQWELQAGGDTAARSVPESLRQMIDEQLERLSPEDRRVLEVASVAGLDCTATIVAAGVQAAVEEVEERCDAVARRGHFLQAAGLAHWPDGTMSGRYRFLHALYQEVLYDRVAATRRVRLHRLIGERIEAGYGDRAREIAGELALHFERGQAPWQAVRYHEQAAETATRRSAPREAVHHVRAALALLTALPDTRERTEQELRLQLALGTSLIAIAGYAAPDVEQAYTRARHLCLQSGEDPHVFPALCGLAFFYGVRAEVHLAREFTQHVLRMAQEQQDPALLLAAHLFDAMLCFYLGDCREARAHLERSLTVYDPRQHSSQMLLYGQDPGVCGLSFAAVLLWLLGYPEQAAQRSRDALALAERLSHPFSHALALNFAADLAQCRRDGQEAQRHAELVMGMAREQGFPYWAAQGAIVRGWALGEQGHLEDGITQTCHGLDALRATGAALDLPRYLGLLAESYGKRGQTEEGLKTVADALARVNRTGERYWEAELHRLTGELTLQKGHGSRIEKAKGERRKAKIPNTHHVTLNTQAEAEAEACFLKAIEIARQQQAKSLELRTATSLARLWQQQGKQTEARQLLAEVYGWFTEGFDTVDLKDASALLDELS